MGTVSKYTILAVDDDEMDSKSHGQFFVKWDIPM